MLGIGAGKINMALEKTNFVEGETINGSAELTVKSNVKARGVIVKAWGERQVRTYSSSKASSRTEILFEVEKQLDGEKEYMKSAEPLKYNFSMQIPENALRQAKFGEGAIGSVLNIAQQFTQGQSRFYVQAKLDIPMGFDVSKKMQIYISPKQK